MCGLRFFTNRGSKSQRFGCDSSITSMENINGQLIGLKGTVRRVESKKYIVIYNPLMQFKTNTVHYPDIA